MSNEKPTDSVLSFLNDSASYEVSADWLVKNQTPILETENYKLFADPTTVEILMMVGSVLIELWKGSRDNDESQKVGEWLSRIENKVDQLNKRIEAVQNDLRDLKVYIDMAFIRSAVINLHAEIDVFNDNHSEWNSLPRSSTTIGQMEGTLNNIQRAVRIVMKYGYASIYYVALSMRYEVDLLQATNKSRDSVNKALERYIKYFTDARSSDEEGSVGNTLKKVQLEIRKLIDSFPGAYRDEAFIAAIDWQEGNYDCGGQVFAIYTGFLKTGFSMELQVRNVGKTQTRGEPRDRHFSLTVTTDENAFTSDLDSKLEEVRPTARKRLDFLNSLTGRYKEYLAQERILEVAMDRVRDHLLKAQELLA